MFQLQEESLLLFYSTLGTLHLLDQYPQSKNMKKKLNEEQLEIHIFKV